MADFFRESPIREFTGPEVRWVSFYRTSSLSVRKDDTGSAFIARLDEIIEILESGKNNVNNIGSCYCEKIVESVIVPLSHHCMALGNHVRAFYYLLECAAAYVQLSNNYMVSRTSSFLLPSVS
ncbi:UNVERIFIED_CONTAM: hypothetical protein K2H54_030301 [Gekko kuhli]